MGLLLDVMMGVRVKSPKEVVTIAHAMSINPGDHKEYDVFASSVRYAPGGLAWWEEFRVVGKIRAYNSVHAMRVAKSTYPEHERLAVMAAAHPLSPSSKAKAALETSMVLNKVQGNKHDRR